MNVLELKLFMPKGFELKVNFFLFFEKVYVRIFLPLSLNFF